MKNNFLQRVVAIFGTQDMGNKMENSEEFLYSHRLRRSLYDHGRSGEEKRVFGKNM